MLARHRRGAARFGAAALLATTALLTAASPAAADTVPLQNRSYTIKVEKVFSGKETDDSALGTIFTSDEIYVGFKSTFTSSTVGRGGTSEVQTRLMGDFDTGETQFLANDQNCLSFASVTANTGAQYLSGFSNDRWGPCSNAGSGAPFSITSKMHESDTESCAAPCLPGVPASAVLDRRGGGDDAMRTKTLSFSREGLAVDLPNQGDSKRYTVVDHFGSGGSYDVTYLVQRMF